MKRINTIILFFCCSVSFLIAQESYDLNRCITIGLENNYEIRIMYNDTEIAKNNATLGNAGALPTLDLNGNMATSIDNEHRKLRDGNEEDNNNINAASSNVGLSLNWMLFDGFGIQADYAKLKELKRMGELNLRMTIEDFIASISAEYYNLIRQNIRLNNLRSTVSLSKERLRIVEERYNIGSMSRLDLQQAKVDFNADSSKLLTQFEEVFASRIRLNEMMAIENVDQPVILKDSIIYPSVDLNLTDLWNKTLSCNTSLLLAEKNKTLSQIDYKRVKSRNYPYLKLTANYGLNNNWNEIGTTELQRRLGLNAGVTVGVNLFDGLNRRRTQRNAKIEIQNQGLKEEQLILSLKASMSNFWMAYQNNLELWKLEKENLVTAKENYAIAIERYKLGDLSGIELREAQNSLLEAEERRSIAEYATKLCEISLLQLSGEIVNEIKGSVKQTLPEL